MLNIAYDTVPANSTLKEGLLHGLQAFEWDLTDINYLETYTLWVVEHQIELGLITRQSPSN